MNEESLEGLFAEVQAVADAEEEALDREEAEAPAPIESLVAAAVLEPAIALAFEPVGVPLAADETREGEQMRLL